MASSKLHAPMAAQHRLSTCSGAGGPQQYTQFLPRLRSSEAIATSSSTMAVRTMPPIQMRDILYAAALEVQQEARSVNDMSADSASVSAAWARWTDRAAHGGCYLLLLAAYYSPLTTHYSLLTTHYSLLTTHYLPKVEITTPFDQWLSSYHVSLLLTTYYSLLT